jgi:outer membrane protein TolC
VLEQELNIVKNDAFRFRGWRRHMPFLNLYTNAGYYKMSDRDFQEIDSSLNLTYNLSARYPIYAFGAIEAEREAAFLREKLAQHSAVIEWRRLVNEIRQSFYRAVILKGDIATQEKQVALEKRRQSRSAANRDIGRLSEAEHLAREVDIRQRELTLNTVKIELANILAQLRITTGFDTLTLADIPADIASPAVDCALLERRLEAFRPRAAANDTEETRRDITYRALLDEEITQAEARALPNISLGASISQSPYQINDRFEMRTQLFGGISATWNLFDRDITNTTVRSLRTEQRLVDARMRTGKVNRLNNMTAQIAQIRAAQELLALRTQNLDAASKNLEGVSKNLDLGRTDSLALEEAETYVATVRQGILHDRVTIARAYFQFQSDIEHDPAVTLYTVPSNED